MTRQRAKRTLNQYVHVKRLRQNPIENQVVSEINGQKSSNRLILFGVSRNDFFEGKKI